MNRRTTMIEPLEARTLLTASMVKDINPTPWTYPGMWGVVPAGNFAYVTQEDTDHGWELWRTDGTEAGTTLVKDIRPGRDGSEPGNFVHVGGGTVFFTADDGANGVELWKSDGTAAGTVLVKDINPGAAGSTPGYLTNVNGTVYFSATNGAAGFELWKSDGTAGGTVMVEEIVAGPTGGNPNALVNNNGVLFFRAATPTSGFELWKSDGTDAGTAMVKELYAGSTAGAVDNRSSNMVALNGFVYFVGNAVGTGRELWKSDGTDAGTTMVHEIYTGSSTGTWANLKTSGNLVYFTVSVGGGFDGLWRTDGTSPGTTRVHATLPYASADVDGQFFFGAGATPTTHTLYKTDGTSVTALRGGLALDNLGFGNGNGTLYFTADDASGVGEELWKSDGTPGGTTMVTDFVPGPTGSSPYAIVGFGGAGQALLGMFTPDTGGALFKTNGTAAGTQLVKDIFGGTDAGMGFFPTVYKGQLYFQAFDGVSSGTAGGELYKTDGTEAGTQLVIDLNPGLAGANIRGMKVFGDWLYFAATNGATGIELWRTNGTAAGTSLVKDIDARPDGGEPAGFTISGDYMYFSATTTDHARELWRTDGTEAGTIRLTDINATPPAPVTPNPGDSRVNSFTDFEGWLYFTAENPLDTFGGLWKTNGNSVVQVSGPAIDRPFTAVSSMLNVNGTLYIAGTTAASGAELFRIDPGQTTPVLVKEIVGGSSSSSPLNLTAVGNALFFSASATGGRELWRTDGTDAGTVRVKDIHPSGNGSPTNMVAANGVLYFSADNGAGRELWRSDGTDAGTYMVKDIAPAGAASGTPSRLYAAHGFVYFSADDGVHGLEAWRTDGTADGTVMLGDYMPEGMFIDTWPANAAFFTALGGDVYYRFNDYAHGDELWKAARPDFAVLGAGGVLTIRATANDDVIDVARDGSGGVVVTLNGITETFAAEEVAAIDLIGHAGRDTLNLTSGQIAFATDAGAGTPNLTLRIAAGASAVFNTTQHLAALQLNGGSAALPAGGAKVLVLEQISIGSGGTLDLADNDMIVRYAGGSPIGAADGGLYEGVTGLIQRGFNEGTWDGVNGIVTSMPDAPTGLTTLAVAEAADVFGLAGDQTTIWNGETIDASTVIVKYTYGGDTNFDGKLDADDYGTIDFSVLVPNTFGYYAGDFNFDGKVDADDYGVIDFNILAQIGIL